MRRLLSSSILMLVLSGTARAQSDNQPLAPAPAAAAAATDQTPVAAPPAEVPAPAPAALALEPPSVLPGPCGPADGAPIEPLAPIDSWRLAAARTTLLGLDGYYRLRSQIFHNLDLKNGSSPFVRPAGGGDHFDSFASWDMRLRLQPALRVTETLRVVSTIDVLDNLVFGSTPAYLPGGDGAGALLGHSQATPRSGFNAVQDSLAVKRLWLEADLFDQRARLIAGRVPAHFGLGLNYNDGNCLQCDVGDAADRLQVVIDLGDITLAPTYDLLSSGLLRRPAGRMDGQVFDLDNVDDSFELSLLVGHRLDEDQRAARLAAGESVLDFGVLPSYRRAGRQLRSRWLGEDYDPLLSGVAVDDLYYATDGRAYAIDGWVGYFAPGLRLEVEGLLSYLEYRTEDGRRVSGLQYALAFEGHLQPAATGRKLTVSLLAGVASGDPDAGMGAFGDRAAQAASDNELSNFVVHPSYHVDLVLFRQLVGAITDAFYIKPTVSYLFTDLIGGSAGVLYGQALYGESTPSWADGQGDPSAPLGVELDAELYFRSEGVLGIEGFELPWDRSPQRLGGHELAHPVKGGLVGSIAYGLCFPLGAWRNNDPAFVGDDDARKPTTMVHAFMARLAVVF